MKKTNLLSVLLLMGLGVSLSACGMEFNFMGVVGSDDLTVGFPGFGGGSSSKESDDDDDGSTVKPSGDDEGTTPTFAVELAPEDLETCLLGYLDSSEAFHFVSLSEEDVYSFTTNYEEAMKIYLDIDDEDIGPILLYIGEGNYLTCSEDYTLGYKYLEDTSFNVDPLTGHLSVTIEGEEEEEIELTLVYTSDGFYFLSSEELDSDDIIYLTLISVTYPDTGE